MTVRVRYDGKVFVPSEPVDLPPGAMADVILPPSRTTDHRFTEPLRPIIIGLDPETARAIAEDPEFRSENM